MVFRLELAEISPQDNIELTGDVDKSCPHITSREPRVDNLLWSAVDNGGAGATGQATDSTAVLIHAARRNHDRGQHLF